MIASRAAHFSWIALAATVLLMTSTRTEAQILPPPSCTLGMSSVAFGNYNPLSSTSLDTTGSVTFTCNATAALPTIASSRGSSSTFTPRTMVRAGGGSLSYNVYLDALHLIVWGDGSDLSTQRFNAVGLVGSMTFYGRVPPSQNAPAGSYSDSLVVTIFF